MISIIDPNNRDYDEQPYYQCIYINSTESILHCSECKLRWSNSWGKPRGSNTQEVCIVLGHSSVLRDQDRKGTQLPAQYAE